MTPSSSPSAPSPPPSTSSSSARRRPVAALLAAVLVIAVGLGAWWILRPTPEAMGPTRLVDAGPVVTPDHLPPLVPGLLSVQDARWTPEGWWVLDGRTHRVHRLDETLHPVVSFGGRGQAPGEFLQASALAVVGDTVVVLDAGSEAMLHYLSPSGDFLHKLSVRVEGCPSFLADDLVETGGPGAVTLLLTGTCNRLVPTPAVGPAVVEIGSSGDGVVVTGTVVAGSMAPMRPDRPRPPDVGVVVELGDGLWAGSSASPCFTPVDPALPSGSTGANGEAPASGSPPLFCPSEWTGVRFSLDDMNPGFMDRPGAARMAQLLADIRHLPFMDRAFAHDQGIVVRKMSGPNSRELSLLRANGSLTPLRAGLPEATWFGGGEILVAWDGVEGIHLERGPLPFPDA